MAKVIGIGGIFFKSSDWEKLSAWYRDVLGIEFRDWGGAVFTPDMLADASGPATIWASSPGMSLIIRKTRLARPSTVSAASPSRRARNRR